jgi:L-threonylcarbamoyladenylate synthase
VKRLVIDPSAPSPEVLAEAAALLRDGGLVAFPTETVYGLGAHALDERAIARIFAAKGRPSYNPLIAHVADLQGARALTRDWPEAAERLAERYWPGPLTMVLPKRSSVPDLLTAGLPSVAVRVPAHPVALALLRAAALPIAAPSANPFMRVSPTTADHVERGLGERVDLILDGGPAGVGIESTVIGLTGSEPVLLRPGSISIEEVEAVIGGPLREAAPAGVDAARPAPGMLDRHYAPRARLVLVPAERREELAARASEALGAGLTVGALLRSPLTPPSARTGAWHPIVVPDGPQAYARALYAALHRLDEAGCDLILVEGVPEVPEWAGIRDRLSRAARPA